MTQIEHTFYKFAFTTNLPTEGAIGSKLNAEETKARINDELTAILGEGNFELTMFEEMTDEEVAPFREAMAEAEEADGEDTAVTIH